MVEVADLRPARDESLPGQAWLQSVSYCDLASDPFGRRLGVLRLTCVAHAIPAEDEVHTAGGFAPRLLSPGGIAGHEEKQGVVGVEHRHRAHLWPTRKPPVVALVWPQPVCGQDIAADGR
ncbi:MAG: hypothetical protein AMJ38_02760 [Dehalococcoidia bacterium DG_22]|nr:MAG: hypothetical protein AMJ38_02760 [Dehalococcoidia bacterium DG_22]